LAALLAGRILLAGRVATVVLSGGNVEPGLFSLALSSSDGPAQLNL